MNIKVIIVTYNPLQWLKKCLGSLNKSTVKLEIIVIDNGSTDGSVDVIKNEYKDVKLIVNTENKGFGQANNQGLSIALNEHADYAFLLNQDAWIEPNTIEKLIEISEKNKRFGVLSPIHLNGKGTKLDRGFSNYVGPNSSLYFSDLVVNQVSNSIYEVPFINAAAWLLTKECIESVGGFNPSFFHYGEDNNYCNRVIFHDLKIGFTPSTFIYHDREERKTNTYFDDFEKNYSKSIIAKISKPDMNNSVTYSITLKDIAKQILKLQFNNALSIINFIFKTSFRKVKRNQKITKLKGPSFLKNSTLRIP